MTISMAQLRSETLRHLGVDANDIDASGSTILDLMINRAWWEICDTFKFKEKEKSKTFVTVAGTRSYVLNTLISTDLLEAIEAISILSPQDSQHIPLNPVSIPWYEENYNEQTTLRAIPTGYFHNGGNLFLYPTPDAIYTLTIWYKFVLSDLSSTIAIPQIWHEAILYGAIHRGFLRQRDYNAAAHMLQIQKLKIAEISSTDAKEDANIHMSGVRVLRPTYSVRHQ